MTGYILTGAGALLYVTTLVLLFRDCYRDYGSTMGGEMLAGALWAVGSLLAAPGYCLVAGISIFWAIPGAVILYVAGLPCRAVIARIGWKYGKGAPRRESSGFAEHIRRVEALQKKNRGCRME